MGILVGLQTPALELLKNLFKLPERRLLHSNIRTDEDNNFIQKLQTFSIFFQKNGHPSIKVFLVSEV